MSDWRFLFTQSRGTLLAILFFVVMFAIYTSNHPAGFTANVVQTAANKGVLLALVAMAQTFVVITAGIDLSVGAVMVLTNCLASWIVVGTATSATLGILGVLLTGLVCGAINGLIVIYGRLQPIVVTPTRISVQGSAVPIVCATVWVGNEYDVPNRSVAMFRR